MSLNRIRAVLQIESEVNENLHTTMKTKGPNVMAVELSTAIYAGALAFISQCEAAGHSPSYYLAYTFACYQMAHLGGDTVRAHINENTIPTNSVLNEGKLAFALLAITNLLEGNPLSYMVAAEGALMCVAVSTVYNNEGLANAANAICNGVKQQTVNMFNSMINLFKREPQLAPEREMDVALAMKKTN